MRRHIYKDLLLWKEKTKNRKPLILSGARQVGKTHILKEFAQKSFKAAYYFNFEKEQSLAKIFEKDLIPKRIVSELSLFVGADIDLDKDLLIFDEIQACHLALTSLKYFCEEMPELAICAAGSLLGINLSQGSYPVGKVEILKLYPMSLLEFLEALGEKRLLEAIRQSEVDNYLPEVAHQKLWDLVKWYMISGGLPEAVQVFVEKRDNAHQAVKGVRSIQHQLIEGYYADIAKHSGEQNARHVVRVFQNVPAQLARAIDTSSKKFIFKAVIPSGSRYSNLAGPIDWLEAAGLLIRTPLINSAKQPLSAYAKENQFKLFLFDVGILGALSNIDPKTILDYNYGSYKGYVAENLIAQELRAYGNSQLFSWMEGGAELEFVFERDGKVVPVEVKSGTVTHSRSLQAFANRYQPELKIRFSAKNLYLDRQNSLHNYPLYLASRAA